MEGAPAQRKTHQLPEGGQAATELPAALKRQHQPGGWDLAGVGMPVEKWDLRRIQTVVPGLSPQEAVWVASRRAVAEEE